MKKPMHILITLLMVLSLLFTAVSHADAPVGDKEIIDGVRNAADRFTGETEQFDDVTMLCIEYKGR